MARSYANIFCAIWDDEDFCALGSDAQRVYFMLVTQPDITACGSLAVTLRRWGRTVKERDRDRLGPALKELAEARFVITDEDTEELLVRTFVKHDGGYKHAKRVLAVIAYAEAIRSQSIRNAMAFELDRLGVPHGVKTVADDSEPNGNPYPTDSRRSVVTEVSTGHTPKPQPESGNLTPAAILPQRAPVPPVLRDPDTTQAIIGRWIEHCRQRPPERVIGPVSKHVKELLAEGIDPANVERGLAQWAGKGLNPAALPSVVNEVMNARPARPATTDSRAAEALALSERLRASGE